MKQYTDVIAELRYCAGLCHYYNDAPEMRGPDGPEQTTREYFKLQAGTLIRSGWPQAGAALGLAAYAEDLRTQGELLTAEAQRLTDGAAL